MTSRPAPRGTERAAGFTLVEVLVALTIIGLSVVGWMAAYGSELRAMGRAAEVTVATALAEERLETIQLLADDRLPNLPDSLARGTFPEALDGYRWEADARTRSGRRLAELTVTVTWVGGSRTLVTMVPLSAPSGLGSLR